MTARGFVIQRLSAAVLAPLVITHIVVMILAVQGGLSGAEILERTRGSFVWGAFYLVFVIAVALHISVGLQNVLQEWTRLPRGAVIGITHTFTLITLLLGMRAVYAVVWA